MKQRKASAVWQGDLKRGHGRMKLGSGEFEGPYSFASRFQDGSGSNPEELIGAAHAGCFSMALANGLAEGGHVPERIETAATVTLEEAEGGFRITRIALDCRAEVPGLDDQTFQRKAVEAKANCPVSRALAGVEIELSARLRP